MIPETGSPIEVATQIFREAVSCFEGRRFSEALQRVDELRRIGADGPGVGYIRACALLNVGRYGMVLQELKRELSLPNHLSEADALMKEIEQGISHNPVFGEPLPPSAKYIVCGLPPGEFGTGKFFQALIPKATLAGFRPLYPVPGANFGPAERVVISAITGSDVIILHPQTLGLSTFRALHEAGNRISLYVLDNSFFCIRSFNHRAGNPGECFDCLGNSAACHAGCMPFPGNYSKEESLDFLSWLKGVAPSLKFFCQTNHQMLLLKKHFGEQIDCRLIGMVTDEFDLIPGKREFDIVFHGDALTAKGLDFFLELARQLPAYSCLVPIARQMATPFLGGREPSANITFEDVQWGRGLREYVATCRLVMCPSQWSFPVEGALLKSMYFNGNVAVMRSQYGFEREIPEELLLRLDQDISVSAASVSKFLESDISNREKARRWVGKYRSGVDLGNVFPKSS